MSNEGARLEQPLNANERFLYAIAMRLEVLIDQVSALSEHIAKRDGVATQNHTTSDKATEQVKSVKEVVEEKPKRTSRKKKVE